MTSAVPLSPSIADRLSGISIDRERVAITLEG